MNKINTFILGLVLAVSLLLTNSVVVKSFAQDESSVLGIKTVVNQTTIDGTQCVLPSKFITVNNQIPTFSGYTLSNVKVILRIKKDSIQRETLSDANGFWNYTMNKKIKIGKHTLSVLLVDPNGNAGKEVLTCSFEIKNAKGVLGAKTAGLSFLPDYVLFSFLTALIVFALFVLYLFLRRRTRKNS